jgi:hypothetical protein
MFCFKLDKSVTVTWEMLKELHNSHVTGRVCQLRTHRRPDKLFPLWSAWWLIFNMCVIVHHKFIPQEQTVKQHIYSVVLQCLQESVQWRWPEKWWTGDWFLHHDILLLTLHFARVYGNNVNTTGAQISRLPVVQATKYFMVMPRICGSSVCTLFHVTHLAPRILRWFLECWKIYASMGMTCLTPFILPRSSTL